MIRTNFGRLYIARGFIHGLCAGIVLPLLGVMACKKTDELPKEGPIKPMQEYTLDNAREWSGIAKDHAPTARKSVSNGVPSVLIEVPMPHKNEGHYIEKIGVMDMQGHELAVQTLRREKNPTTYAYIDQKVLPWSGKVKIFAKCNKHDLWVNEMNARELVE